MQSVAITAEVMNVAVNTPVIAGLGAISVFGVTVACNDVSFELLACNALSFPTRKGMSGDGPKFWAGRFGKQAGGVATGKDNFLIATNLSEFEF